MKTFYNLLVNTTISSITNYTVWFAIIFFVYLETQSVFATSIISGLFLAGTAITGIWFGSLVDQNKKKTILIVSSVVSLITFAICLVIYLIFPKGTFSRIENPLLWVF